MKPHPISRLIHDFLSALPPAFLPPLNAVTDQSLPSAGEKVCVQKAGRTELFHPLEAAFYGAEQASSQVHFPEITALRLNNVFLTGDQGYVFLPDGRWLNLGTGLWSENPRKVRRPIRCMARRAGGALFHLTGVNHENHAHFAVDHLQRYFAARQVMARLPDRILVAPGHRRWQARYLKLLGVEESCLVEGTPGTLRVEELLLVPLLGGNTQFGDPALFKAMAAEMQRNIRQSGWHVPAAEAAGRRTVLWISRRDAPERQIENEEALVLAAQKILGDVDVIRLSELSLEEQIRRLSRCWCVIGAQGQGMLLPTFAHGKMVVILEQAGLNKDQGWDAAFRDMAELAGNRALRLFSGMGPRVHDQHWLYPEEKFTTDLRRLLSVAEMKG